MEPGSYWRSGTEHGLVASYRAEPRAYIMLCISVVVALSCIINRKNSIFLNCHLKDRTDLVFIHVALKLDTTEMEI